MGTWMDVKLDSTTHPFHLPHLTNTTAHHSTPNTHDIFIQYIITSSHSTSAEKYYITYEHNLTFTEGPLVHISILWGLHFLWLIWFFSCFVFHCFLSLASFFRLLYPIVANTFVTIKHVGRIYSFLDFLKACKNCTSIRKFLLWNAQSFPLCMWPS